MVRVIAELGSCHMGKLEYIKEAIDRCKDNGIDALKLQLFPAEFPYIGSGNVHLRPDYFRDAFEYGLKVNLPVSASVFNDVYFKFLLSLKPSFIKFSYSKKNEEEQIAETIEAGIEAIVSCDVMTDRALPARSTKLYCISEYPVKYEIAFDGLFGGNYPISSRLTKEDLEPGAIWYEPSPTIIRIPGRFDGFSDHTLGMRQTFRAVEAGAKIIEKHVTLSHSDIGCPDSYFAVSIEELGQLKK